MKTTVLILVNFIAGIIAESALCLHNFTTISSGSVKTFTLNESVCKYYIKLPSKNAKVFVKWKEFHVKDTSNPCQDNYVEFLSGCINTVTERYCLNSLAYLPNDYLSHDNCLTINHVLKSFTTSNRGFSLEFFSFYGMVNETQLCDQSKVQTLNQTIGLIYPPMYMNDSGTIVYPSNSYCRWKVMRKRFKSLMLFLRSSLNVTNSCDNQFDSFHLTPTFVNRTGSLHTYYSRSFKYCGGPQMVFKFDHNNYVNIEFQKGKFNTRLNFLYITVDKDATVHGDVIRDVTVIPTERTTSTSISTSPTRITTTTTTTVPSTPTLYTHSSSSSSTPYSGCGGYFRKESGVITSPNYPYPYPSGLYCLYGIRLNTPQNVVFDIIDAQLESSRCNYDYIQIQSDFGVLGPYCERSKIFAYGSFFEIKFVSNGYISGRGFKLAWYIGISPTTHIPESESNTASIVAAIVVPTVTPVIIIFVFVTYFCCKKKSKENNIQANRHAVDVNVIEINVMENNVGQNNDDGVLQQSQDNDLSLPSYQDVMNASLNRPPRYEDIFDVNAHVDNLPPYEHVVNDRRWQRTRPSI